MKFFTSLCCYFLLFIGPICPAQNSELKFYSEEILGEGQENVFQDSYGFVWFSSYEGVARWDGSNLKKYQFNPKDSTSLSSNICYTFFEDHQRRLWIGTINGLNLYQRANDNFKRCSSFDSSLVTPINCIKEDSKKQLWLGTSKGLCLYHPKQQKAQWIPECAQTIFALAIASDNKIWTGTYDSGLCLYDPIKKSTQFFLTNINSGIKSLLIDNQKNLWVGTLEKGIFKLNSQGKTRENFSQFSKGNVKCIFQDKGKNIWVGLEGFPLYCLEKGKNSFSEINQRAINNYFRQTNTVYNIAEDNFGNLWFTTKGNGVLYTNIHKNKIKLRFNKAEVNGVSRRSTITSFCELNNNIYVGTEGGLGIINTISKNFEFLSNNLSSQLIQDIKADKNGNLWMATWGGGLIKFNPNTKSFNTYKTQQNQPKSLHCNNIKSIWIEEDFIWIGTHGGGLEKLNTITGEFEIISEHPIWINHLFKDSKNRLWVSSYSGILLLENNTKTFFQENSKPGSLANSAVNMVTEDKNGNIWVISDAGGLQQFQEQNRSFTSSDKNVPLCIKSILIDKQNTAWLGTTQGLVQYNLKTHNSKTFHGEDGFQGELYVHKACLLSKSGEIYMGGTNGFNHFFSQNLKHQLPATQLYLNDYRYTQKVELKEQANHLSLSFSVIDLYNPSQLKIAYQLKGLQNEWTTLPAKQNYLSFASLPAGNYSLYLKYSYGNNEWSLAQKTMEIAVLSPWWKKTWFIILAILMFLLLIVFFVKSRTAVIEKRNELLQGELEEKKDELLIQHETLESLQEEQERQAAKIITQQNSLASTSSFELQQEFFSKIKGKKIILDLQNKEIEEQIKTLLADALELVDKNENTADFVICDHNLKAINYKKNKDSSHIPLILISEQKTGNLPSLDKVADFNILQQNILVELPQVLTQIVQIQENLQQNRENSSSIFTKLQNHQDKELFDKIMAFVEMQFSNPDFNHQLLCEELNISRTVLYAKIKSITGFGVHEFIRLIRLKKSAELLEEGKLNVSEIAYNVGFNSVSYYIRCFIKAYGLSPKEYASAKSSNNLNLG